MIKKILSSLIVLAMFSTSILFADMVVPASALPKQAATFIKKIYPNAQIWKVERDGGKFDVELSNGASIDFLTNGDWVNIDGEYNGVPFSVLPQAVANTVKKTYPQAMMTSVEKEWGNYKIKLNNMMEMFISSDGSLMGQQFDD
ncbi:PepSY-like domain-containing protein [Brachyspira pilosicoli]|uniref:PepSY-like domain-containing protein n=1 Tax=Brachyspira pilosicoli TaxID=52584 RepID=UPI0012F5156F|nr:PepSY-like domain-containing protein [Brachyspira pilosicoli]